MVNEHVIRAVAVLKEGGQIVANARTRAAEFAEAVDVDVVQVTAVVTDGAGRFITDLKAADFKVYEDDKLKTLSSFAAENIPLELVTAVDVSSSMTDALPAVKRHAINFLAQLRPTDQVTVLGFNDNIMTLAKRSTDQAARVRAIRRLEPWGGTALYDVIVQALAILGRQAGRRSLLVFSDGEDQSSRAAVSSVLQRAEASDATIYVIGQGRALKATALQNLMRQLAARSGGRAFFTDDESKLETIFQQIVEDLRHQYLLAYPAPDHARDGEFHRIRVEVPGRGYQVRVRDGYRLDPAESAVDSTHAGHRAAALLLALAASQEPQPPRSTFRSTVDLVPVDVSVVDKNGRPVSDLTAADFTLAVDGKPRRIASAQFISIESAIESAPPPREFTTNAGAATGRLIMLVIDSENIGTGRGKPAIDAARRFIGGLNRADRVALVVLPGVGPQLEFTSNHALVQTMLNTVVGQGSSEFVGPRKIGISEALAIQRNDRMTLQEAVNRECGVDTSPPLLQSCIAQLTGEADQLVTISRHRTRESLLALRNLFERMTAGNTPKTIVLLSEGLLIDRDLSDVAWVAPRASAAHIILYVLQLDSPDMDASVQRMSPSRGADREIMRQGLDHLAGLARGDVFRVIGNADFAFQRLGLEMSGYYLLSFEPEPGDRDGKPHKIKIDVARKDLHLRSRREFNVGPREAMGTEDVLRETLRTPLLAPDIPLRLTTYTFQDPESSKLKILLAAEIDRSTNADQKIALGYTLTDETGQIVAGAVEKVVDDSDRT